MRVIVWQQKRFSPWTVIPNAIFTHIVLVFPENDSSQLFISFQKLCLYELLFYSAILLSLSLIWTLVFKRTWSDQVSTAYKVSYSCKNKCLWFPTFLIYWLYLNECYIYYYDYYYYFISIYISVNKSQILFNDLFTAFKLNGFINLSCSRTWSVPVVLNYNFFKVLC